MIDHVDGLGEGGFDTCKCGFIPEGDGEVGFSKAMAGDEDEAFLFGEVAFLSHLKEATFPR